MKKFVMSKSILISEKSFIQHDVANKQLKEENQNENENEQLQKK